MADMLATALFHTNRYIVLERQQLGDVLREQDLAASGRVRNQKLRVDKQQIVEEMIKRTELSRLNQLMIQINGVQRLKNETQQALNGRSLKDHHIFRVLTA